ncbi:MAG: ABC transporter substrate-binding protein [Candidatus Promineifilaceae bacterium]
MRRILFLFFSLAMVLLILTACQAELANPPRIATAAANATRLAQPTKESIYLAVPTTTSAPGAPAVANAPEPHSLHIWINETSDEHRQALNTMVADFHERSGIEVELQFIDPALLPDLAHTAVLSDTLPDVILHPLEFTMSWREDGILDAQVADAIVNELGTATFDPGALDLVRQDGLVTGVPSDGYQQILLYRSDWFADEGLEPPSNYETMLAGAEALFNPDDLRYGLVIPTESNLITTHRAFEHIAIANNCQLVDEAGEVLFLSEPCREALDFYFSIVNQYSPPGVQTDTSARNAYLDSRTAMIIAIPGILPDLVQKNRLNQNTGIITDLSGFLPDNQSANFGNISYLGVTPVADEASAAAFINYWFNEGYQTWLAVDAERKVPMRFGTGDRPRFYIDAWGTTPILQGESLTDIFGPEVVAQLRDGIGLTNRWGFRQGQGALVGHLYDDMTFSIVLQEMLSGYFNSSKTLYEAYNRVIDHIPDYAFPIIPTPEA